LRVVARRQSFPLPEIGGDTDDPFEVDFKDMTAMPCSELATLFEEIRRYRRELFEAGFRGHKEVSIIPFRGSNFNTDVGAALDFLRDQEAFVEGEMARKRCGGPRGELPGKG
jgi:hypothetical protein